MRAPSPQHRHCIFCELKLTHPLDIMHLCGKSHKYLNINKCLNNTNPCFSYYYLFPEIQGTQSIMLKAR